jgi:hypothetical protein
MDKQQAAALEAAADRRGLFGALATLGVGAAALAAATPAEAQRAAARGEGFGGVSLLNRMKVIEEVSRYAWAWDSGDFPAYLDCYAPDGVLEHPKNDGSPGRFEGHAAITEFLSANVKARPSAGFVLQHEFSNFLIAPKGQDIDLKAYCLTFRHFFHRQYWPSVDGPRQGTWEATYTMTPGDRFRLKLLKVKMFTDTAWASGTAIQNRPPGMPGV